MSIAEMVRSDFEEFIRLDSSVPDELRKSLKIKERVPVFIDNLIGQIKHIEVVKPNIKLDRMKIKSLVYDATRLYVHLLKQQVDEMRMSDLQKATKKVELEGNELHNKLDKDGNGDFTEELGVIIKDGVNAGGTAN